MAGATNPAARRTRRTREAIDPFTPKADSAASEELIRGVAAACGLTPVMELGSKLYVAQVQNSADSLARMGISHLDALLNLTVAWETKYAWRRTLPSPHDLVTYQSQLLAGRRELEEKGLDATIASEELVAALAEACGFEKLVEIGDRLAIHDVRYHADLLARMGITTLDELWGLIGEWEDEYSWRNDMNPRDLVQYRSRTKANEEVGNGNG